MQYYIWPSHSSPYRNTLYNKKCKIYMVADVPGRLDTNTPSKHYAAIEEKHKKETFQVDIYGTN